MNGMLLNLHLWMNIGYSSILTKQVGGSEQILGSSFVLLRAYHPRIAVRFVSSCE